MKKLGFGAIALTAIVCGFLSLSHRDSLRKLTSASEDSNQSPRVSNSEKSFVTQGSAAPNNHDRFATEVLPVANDFLARIESLASSGIGLPFNVPVASNQSSRIRFAGGPSNTICTFVVDGHSLLVCHLIKREREINGINVFRRTGTDDTGMPRNIIQLTDDPAKNDAYIRRLANTTEYPARDLQQVAGLAQRTLAVLLPQDFASYRLNESWREQVGETTLPYYTFAFVRKGAPGTDPSNLMRDEIMIGFKSAKNGLILDSFEDNSIAFIGKRK